jgi:capsular polysaccharide transport system permease protein
LRAAYAPDRLRRGLYDQLKAQGRIVLALMIRDVQTRFFGHALGFVVAIAWPVSHIFILIAINAAAGRAAPYGDDPALFFATGLLPFMCFNYMTRFTAMGVFQNKPLLGYPIVKVADVLIARSIVEVLNSGVVIVVTIVILTAWGVDVRPVHPLQAEYALLACMGLGLGFGWFNGIISGIFPFWFTIFSLFQIIMWMASGVILVPDQLPESVRWWLSWNPALIGVEWMRSAFYEGYGVGELLDKRYMLGFDASMMFLGLIMERALRGRVLR